MKLQKRIDPTHSIDQYVLYIPHAEADAAFKVMSPQEKSTIAKLQSTIQVSSLLKALALWAMRIEEVQGVQEQEGDMPDEG